MWGENGSKPCSVRKADISARMGAANKKPPDTPEPWEESRVEALEVSKVKGTEAGGLAKIPYEEQLDP